MKTNDYVKYMTQQFVTYIDSPKEERKQKREMKKSEKEAFVNRWFGVLPLGVSLMYRRYKEKKDA
jgi:YqzE-like protein